MAGKRDGEKDKPLVYRALADLEAGNDTRAELKAQCEDERSLLVVEPLRWALALRPTWIALEQVPPVLELWQEYQRILTANGWRVWTGILSSERYGVPQTRRRAILMAHRDRYPAPPLPTHQAYVPGEPAQHEMTLEGELLPWVSMAEALGWGEGKVGFPRLNDTPSNRPAPGDDGKYRERDFRDTSEPAFNLTEKARSWTLRAGTGENEAERSSDQPAPTMRFGARLNTVQWVSNNRQLFPPEFRGRAEDYTEDGEYTGKRAGDGAVRVTEQEAAILQGFPPDYPFQGSRTKRFEQIGNAVPPPLARAVLTELAGEAEARRAA